MKKPINKFDFDDEQTLYDMVPEEERELYPDFQYNKIPLNKKDLRHRLNDIEDMMDDRENEWFL